MIRFAFFVHRVRSWILPTGMDGAIDDLFMAAIERRPWSIYVPTDPDVIRIEREKWHRRHA
jgi:hypothetical protein